MKHLFFKKGLPFLAIIGFLVIGGLFGSAKGVMAEEGGSEALALGDVTFTNDDEGNLVLTVKASDNEGLASLEVDHSLGAPGDGTSGLLPEFIVGTETATDSTTGASSTFTDGTWTLSFGPTVSEIIRKNADSMTFYFVITDVNGNKFGDMSPPTAENTRTFAVPAAPDREIIVTSSTSEVVVTSSTQPLDITIPADVDDATINYGSLIAPGSGNIPQTTINSTLAKIEIPASTITSADTTWNGILMAPRATDVVLPSTSGQNKIVNSAIELGLSGDALIFDKAVKITMPGQAGKRAGYIRDGISFTEITTTCDVNSQDWADTNLGTEGDCKIDVNGDLIIWTKHFTKFATYTQTPTPVVPRSGGGGGGSIVSYCSTVTYGDWGSCVSGFQFRSVLSQTPAGCSLSTQQQLDASRACVLGEEPVVVTPPVVAPGSSEARVDVKQVMNHERSLVSKVNTALTNRLAGRILLQVEEKGQAWYVEPVSKQKHFMGRPADAFDMMRRFGLGISEANFSKFEKSGVPARFAGRIFLRVESKGEAYYVNPVDMKMHYLGRPADAFNLMRSKALGISNANIRQIPVGEVK